MHHKTFRELTQHENALRDKFRAQVQSMTSNTLEEMIYLQKIISEMLWLSMQTVEEQQSINQNSNDNEQESI